MTTTSTRERSERLHIRLTPKERELLERAASMNGEDVSSIVRRGALKEARRALAEQDAT